MFVIYLVNIDADDREHYTLQAEFETLEEAHEYAERRHKEDPEIKLALVQE